MKYRFLLVFALFLVVPFAYSQQNNNRIDYNTQSYDLVLDRPNSILSVIPLDTLPKIKSLTIRGELGKDDVSIVFDKCLNLEYLDLKNTSLKEFNITDFSKVRKLRVFKMPSKVTSLSLSAIRYGDSKDLFKDCYNLESVELPSELVRLDCNLFVNCPKITTITIPAKVEEFECIFRNCPSLTIVDLSQCSNIKIPWPGWNSYRLEFEACQNIKTIKYQNGTTNKFHCYGEPEGVSYYFGSNKCFVSRYKNCTLIFKREANNDKTEPVENCTILFPKSMMTHFYAEFNGNNNRLIGLSEITETEIKKALQIEQRRREEELQEQRRREQEQLEIMRQAEAKRKREADSIAHINELISNYSSCRFLFENENDYVACVTGKQQSDINNTIQQLITQKLNTVSDIVKKGKELYENKKAGSEMQKICNICYSKQISQNIVNYTENELESFVSERKALTKAYNKAKKKNQNIKCSEFLTYYIQNN
jgi:hypothetical protein